MQFELTPNAPSRNTPGLSNGVELVPEFTKKNLLSKRLHNLIVQAVNRFRNIQIVRGEFDKVVYAEGGVILQLKDTALTDGQQSQAALSLQRLKVKADPMLAVPRQYNFNDYFTAVTWDGAVEGNVILKVAKQWHVRNARAGRVNRGITTAFTYLYSNVFLDFQRTVTVTVPAGTLDPEIQLLEPPITAGDEIYADDFAATPALSTGVAGVTLMDRTPRFWLSAPKNPPP